MREGKNTDVTIQDVAKAAQVSSATVSRVLNNSASVTSRTAEKVNAAMRALGYRPNIIARGLRMSSTKTVGVIISNVLNPFFSRIVRGIEDAMAPAGYNVIICNTDEDGEKEVNYIKNLIDRRVDGLIIAGSGYVMDYADLLGNTPAVFIDRVPNEEEAKQFDSVTVDNELGAYLLTKQFLQTGKNRIGMIASNVITTGMDRINGFKRAFTEERDSQDGALLEVTDYLGQNTYELAVSLIEEGVDAIFAGNNIILLSVLAAVKDQDRAEDITIGAFDQIDWMRFVDTPLVVVWQPVAEIAKESAIILLGRMNQSNDPIQQIVLPIEVVQE